MDVAQGQYVGFVDGDDYPEKDFYALLLQAAESSCSDIAKGCYRDSEIGYIEDELNAKVRENKTNFSFEFCSCIFLQDFLKKNKISFPEHIRDMEDPVFSFNAALHSNNVAIVNNAHINIFHHSSSSTDGIPDFIRVQHKCQGLKLLQVMANKASITPKSYGYVMAKWCLITLNNASRNRSLLARQYLADTLTLFLENLIHSEYFIQAANTLWNGAGSYLHNCSSEDFPFFIEDMNLCSCQEKLHKEQQKNKQLMQKNKQLSVYIARTLSVKQVRCHA